MNLDQEIWIRGLKLVNWSTNQDTSCGFVSTHAVATTVYVQGTIDNDKI